MNLPFVQVIDELKYRALVQQHTMALEHCEEDLNEPLEKVKFIKRKTKKHTEALKEAQKKLEEVINETN